MKTTVQQFFHTAIVILSIVQFINAQPPIEGDWEPMIEFTDNFNEGQLNTIKWNDKDLAWKGRWPSYFAPENVSIADGKLRLRCVKALIGQVPEVLDSDIPEGKTKGPFTHTTAAIKSKTRVKYGYFEAKMKASNSRYFNSFWLYDSTKYPDSTKKQHTELDIAEIVAERNYLVTTAHRFYDLPDYIGNSSNSDAPHYKDQKEFRDWVSGDDWFTFFYDGFFSEYHVYALDWNEKYLTWYIDGKEIFKVENKYYHQELYVLFDAEVNVWPEVEATEDVTFEIDYVRAWKDNSVNRITSVKAPTHVVPGEMITFPVGYVAHSPKTISCTFQQSSAQGNSYVTATEIVGTGSGMKTLTMTIPNDVALGNGYQFQTLIGDGTWEGRKDNLLIKPVIVNRTAMENVIAKKYNNAIGNLVYPNPTKGLVNLNLSSAFKGEVNVKVISLDGKVVKQTTLLKNKNQVENTLDLTNLNAGMYIINIDNGKEFENIKVIKL